MNDPKVIAAAKNAVKVIIRRPHAYKFKQQHMKAPIPGFVVLDGDGKYLGGVRLPSDDAVEQITRLLKR